MQPLYVSLGTPRYGRDLDRLTASLRRLDLPHLFERPEAEAAGWIAGVHLRVPLLLSIRRERPDVPLVWIDADAVVWEDPAALWPDPADADFAAHRFRGRELLGGTTWWAATPAATRLLEVWQAENERRPATRDQHNLEAALRCVQTAGGLRARDLPPELCWIFDLSPRAYPDGGPPVIEHFQASREFRGGRGGRR